MRSFKYFCYMLLPLFVSSMAYGAEGSTGDSNVGFKFLATAIAIGFPMLGGTLGLGKTGAAMLEGVSRNPQASKSMFTPFVLSLAFIEVQALLAFIVALVIFFL